jgi:hypothetical protein
VLIALAAGLSVVGQPIASAQVLSPQPRRAAKWTAEVYAGAVMSPTPTAIQHHRQRSIVAHWLDCRFEHLHRQWSRYPDPADRGILRPI